MKKLVYSEVFNGAWAAIKDDLALVMGLTLVILFGSWVVMLVPYIGFVLVAPLSLGYYRALMKIRQKQTIGYEDVLWGFTDFNRLLHALILNLIISVGLAFGLCLLVFPGIWFLVAALFAWPLFATDTPDGVQAIQKSIALVKGRWWNVAGFSFFSFLLLMAGSLFFGIGILITLPLFTIANVIAVEKLQGPEVLVGPANDPVTAVTPEVVNTPS
jgi:uncharacterized membrane protein